MHDNVCSIQRNNYNSRICNTFVNVRDGNRSALSDHWMRTYYRLLMFNLAVMAPLTYGVWLHNLRKTGFIGSFNCSAFCELYNCEEGCPPKRPLFLKNIKWRSGLLWAWTLGPVSTGWLPLMFASLLVKTLFSGIVDMGLVAYGAFSCWSTVSRSEEWRINNSAKSRPIDPRRLRVT